MATMEEVLVPLYLHHRYQVSAAASPLGGIDYIYSLRGDGRTPVEPISREDQMAALDALLATISSDELTLPDTVVTMLPPRPTGFGGGRELFPRYTGSSFDVITPAVVAADHTVSEILNGQRAARLVQQHAVTESLPGLGEVIDELVEATFGAQPTNGYEAEINRAVERVVAEHLMRLAGSAQMPQVRAIATFALERLNARIESEDGVSADDEPHYNLVSRDIERFLSRPGAVYTQVVIPGAPPGAPIGEPALDYLGSWSGAGFSSLSLEPYCSQDELFWR
jgi:hypothetical protein